MKKRGLAAFLACVIPCPWNFAVCAGIFFILILIFTFVVNIFIPVITLTPSVA